MNAPREALRLSTRGRKRLLREISAGLAHEGYTPVPELQTGAAALWAQRHDVLFLCLGVEFSSTIEASFSASYYLSRIPEWGYLPLGFPAAAYDRIAVFLGVADRVRLLDDVYTAPGVLDGWWAVNDVDAVPKFLEAERLARPHFLAQSKLVDEVIRCNDLRLFCETVLQIVRLANSDSADDSTDFVFQPKLYKNAEVRRFCQAAERYLRAQDPARLKRPFVELCGTAAWRLTKMLL